MSLTRFAVFALPVALVAAPLTAQTPTRPARPAPARSDATAAVGRNLTTDPTLYVVGYAHLDTEWRWEYPQVISEYLPNTMHDNFALFEKYPDYVFNFSGANRYRLIKEYWPADYARMAAYIKAGRWFPAGSSMEEGDVNSPSAEGILRQFLYGNEYFRKEFGVASLEYMLPDCFGFPWSLPSLLAHAGIKGFSTQKLVWGSSVPDQPTTPYGEKGQGIPFNVGMWIGPDGNGVIAALNPGDYGGKVHENLSTATAMDNRPSGRGATAQTFLARLQEDGKQLGIMADYHYYGTGDVGGSPTDSSVYWIEQSILHPAGAIKVISSKADQMFKDITPAEQAKLPRYSGEMELTNHSAGSLTSEAYQKRWIRQNEILADAAEKASLTAAWLGGPKYPMERLNSAWTLMMGGHFHDLAAGTATPKAYEFAWNDDVIAMNTLAGVVSSATASVAQAMNTATRGTPVVVYNPLNIARADLVTATVPIHGAAHVAVVNPAGASVPAQILSTTDSSTTVTFLAQVPSVGYAVYGVSATAAAPTAASALHVDNRSLENARYKVRLDDNGDIASIMDKSVGRELLAAPIRLALLHDNPSQWPAWNMDFADEQAAPRAYVGGTAAIRVSQNGPARVAITVDRTTDGSHFVQTISLAAGDAGNRVEIGNVIDWRTGETALKAVFPLTASDTVATYNWDVGTIKRATEYDRKFEVPSHQWIDQTDHTGRFGATILTDDKNGSDKRDDHTIRLTLLRSPGTRGGYQDQASQDWGHHEFSYGIAGHAGDFRTGQTDWQAWRLNTPLMAFVAPAHAGAAGKTLSLLKVSDPRIRVLALKRAEASDEWIVRIVELDGRSHPAVRLTFAAPVVAAREVNGQEMPVGPATVATGSLATTMKPFQIRTFAVRLGHAASTIAPARSATVSLSYDRAVASRDSQHMADGFTANGALPAEMIPARIDYDGIQFAMAPTSGRNAVTPRGQKVTLPAGHWTRVYVLAAADGDQAVTFSAGKSSVPVTVEDWGGYVGQWDYRTMTRVPAPPLSAAQQAQQDARQRRADSLRQLRIDSVRKAGGDTTTIPPRRVPGPRLIDAMASLNPGYIKPADIAWFASHHHDAAGLNQFYSYSYLFAYPIDLPPGTTSITLPDNDKVRILAMTVTAQPTGVHAAAPLYDTLGRTAP
ncbi:MAG TPA: glycoside hydrolase family 38 C-terminal domain-containing protein [Gemmatimonadales bacterium]